MCNTLRYDLCVQTCCSTGRVITFLTLWRRTLVLWSLMTVSYTLPYVEDHKLMTVITVAVQMWLLSMLDMSGQCYSCTLCCCFPWHFGQMLFSEHASVTNLGLDSVQLMLLPMHERCASLCHHCSTEVKLYCANHSSASFYWPTLSFKTRFK